MLAKVSWQSINCAIEPDECRHARMIFRQACLFDLRFEFERVREIATSKQMGETIDNAWRKIERFPDLACRATPAVTDYICCHRGAVIPVAAINFLNHCFAPVTAGEIQIDIRPAFTALV